MDDSIQQKRCSKCGEIKDIDLFHKNISKRGGLNNWCKQCNNAYCKEYNRLGALSKREMSLKFKRCALCRHLKPLDQFSPHDLSTDGLQSLCNQCLDAPSSEIMSTCKKCTKCENWLPFSDFHKSKSSRDKLSWWCKKCKREHDKSLPPDHWRKSHLQHYYRSTPQQYQDMFKDQGGVCAACGRPETHRSSNGKGNVRALAVDHNHETGAVRALLCHECNTAYGLLLEDEKRILALLTYHRRFNKSN